MSIPLDRLYHYIDALAEEIQNDGVIIYRFFPHGSKKIDDFAALKNYNCFEMSLRPILICNDQEPLNFNFYEIPENSFSSFYRSNIKRITEIYDDLGLPITGNLYSSFNDDAHIYDKVLILHSEKRSDDVDLYKQSDYIPVYYWCHAVLALDWFRFSKHVKFKKHAQKTFLVYNRSWTGTREYRLKFIDHLITNNLHNDCMTSFNAVDPELTVLYKHHEFKNKIWEPKNNLENYFDTNKVSAAASADFIIEDYNATEIEVVLETLFDDQRLHLTEKTLRPLACQQPFILAATHGSLEYLRSYGFVTFSDVWNEDYDQIKDPNQRLEAVCKLMKEISNWDTSTKKIKLAQAAEIAQYNRNYFFSQDFFDRIVNELRHNIKQGLNQLETTNTSKRFFDARKSKKQYPELKSWILGELPESAISRQDLAKIIAKARRYYLRSFGSGKQV